MMDGTAANNSMAVPKGRRKALGKFLSKNRNAKTQWQCNQNSDAEAVTTVPKMAIKPPNFELMMSHSMV
jgi:hypothetical protein